MASDDDYSDLTELESEDDEDTSKKKSKCDDSGKGGYRIRNALKVPRATTYTAQALYDQIHSNDINLEPEYQRDVVWSEAKQIGVIDSIYRNFYIPPIIFAVNCHEDGSETKTCIDGKQRLTSIYKFMDGLIPHRDSETGEKHWYKDSAQATGRPKRKILSPKYRKMFSNKQIVCVEYQEINDAAEREIFQRVQLGMALTPAEKLQVIKTKRADFIRELQNTFLKEEGLLCGGALEWDTGRGSDFRCLAQSVYHMDRSDSGEGMKASSGIQQTEKWLNSRQGFTTEFENSVRDAFTVFANMVQDKKHNHIFKKPAKVSPIEFIMMGVMIFVHKGEASMAQLAAGIAQMRTDVRVTHVDIRMNTRVTKDMIDFIAKWKPPTIPGDAGVPVGNTSLTIGVKRKRPAKNSDDMDVDEEDGGGDDDDDGTYGAPKSKKSSKKAVNGTASTSIVNVPKIKTEPTSTPLPTTMPLPFHPPTDRLAALRRAKEAVAQRQAQRLSQSQNTNPNPNPNLSQSQSQAPSTSRNSGLATPNSANDQASPQMLPSPGLPFSFPSSSANTQQQHRMSSSSSTQLPLPLPNASGSGPTIRIPPLGQSTSTVSTNSSLTGSSHRIPSSSSSRSNVLPPPPSSGSSLVSDRDQEDRDSRSREPPSLRDSRDYDDRDRHRTSFNLPPRRR